MTQKEIIGEIIGDREVLNTTSSPNTQKQITMAQQTAVEWFYQRILAKDIKQVFEQAKQMEKEQIINAHGLKYYDLTEETINGEQYYNETFTSTPQT